MPMIQQQGNPYQPTYVRDRDMIRVWLYGLSVLFALGVIILVILPVIFSKLVPELLAGFSGITAAQLATITARITMIKYFINIAMYAVMFGVIVYMVMVIWNKEQDSTF